jgi:PAS domain S-box-containing protein
MIRLELPTHLGTLAQVDGEEVLITPSQERKHKGSILVIDDEPASLKPLFTILTEDGYAVHERLLDPESQLRFVNDTLPDLVLVDLRKPDMDGYQVCASLKNDPATRAIPVIFISSINRSINQRKALLSGAVDYVTDPFDAQEVLWRIDTHISLRRLRKNLESAAWNHGAQPIAPNEDLERAFQEIHVLTEVTGRKHAEEKVRQAARELKKAEEALRSNERNLSLMINVIPTFIHVLRADGSMLYANQAVLDYTGLTLDDVWKEDYRARFFHPEDVERLRQERREALTRAVPFENEQRVLGKDGKYRWFLIRYNPLLDEQGRIDRWYVAAFDIEDRKQAYDAQARQAGVRADVSAAFTKPTHLGEILRGCTEAIVRHLDAAFARIWMLNKDEGMLELHASAGMYTRLDGSYGRIPVGDLKIGRIAAEKKAHLTNDVMNDPRLKDKGWAQDNGMVAFAGYPLVVEDRLIGVVALFARRPLSESILDTLASVADTIAQGIERKRAEEALTRARSELAHMARVTTLGALTASIAHDINQPISAAVTSAGACLRWLNRDQPDVQRAREAAMRIEDDGRRAAEIITHLKSFYKKDVSPQREMVSLNDVVGEMLVLLHSEADRHSVLMSTDFAADILPVSADRVQLQQVLMNLMLNGMEAMSERGGQLRISTQREGGDVMVSVSDSGEGIPADKMEEIFNAFVTTKAGGTGMGLAISRTIIESHGGRLWATVNPERGATFRFTLPTEPKAA